MKGEKLLMKLCSFLLQKSKVNILNTQLKNAIENHAAATGISETTICKIKS
jgi:hypothetical protein